MHDSVHVSIHIVKFTIVFVYAHLYLVIKFLSPFLQSLANHFSLVIGNLCIWMVLSQLFCSLFKAPHQSIILFFSSSELIF